MMRLTIEGLKPKYAMIEKAIGSARVDDEDKQLGMFALDELCRMLVLSSDTYEGMASGLDIVRNAERDMAFVRGELTEEEEKERLDWHYARLEERDRAKYPDLYAEMKADTADEGETEP